MAKRQRGKKAAEIRDFSGLLVTGRKVNPETSGYELQFEGETKYHFSGNGCSYCLRFRTPDQVNKAGDRR